MDSKSESENKIIDNSNKGEENVGEENVGDENEEDSNTESEKITEQDNELEQEETKNDTNNEKELSEEKSSSSLSNDNANDAFIMSINKFPFQRTQSIDIPENKEHSTPRMLSIRSKRIVRRKYRRNKIKKIHFNSIWIPITPQMLFDTFRRLRFLKLGPSKQEIIANLRLHYPVRNQFNDLARELRQKLRCAVKRGLLYQNGPHYKLNYGEAKGPRLHKRQINDFWQHYLELRPLSEPRKDPTPIDYEPFAEPI